MIDIQLLSIALAVIAIIVVAISCFLIFGNRERTFEDALAERKGLNILLSGASSDHVQKKSTVKDVKKKKISVGKDQNKGKGKVENLSDGNQDQAGDDIAELVKNVQPDAKEVSETKHKNVGSKTEKIISAESTIQDNNDKPQIDAPKYTIDGAATPEINPSIPTEANKTEQAASGNESPDQEPTDGSNVPRKKNKKPKTAASAAKIDAEKVQVELQLLQGSAAVQDAIPYHNVSILESEDGPAVVWRLKKELQERATLLGQQTEKTNTASRNVKDLKQEVFGEKQKLAQMERNFGEQLNMLRGENNTLNQKVHEFQTQLTTKMQAYRQLETQLMQCRVDQGHAAQAQQLREENNRFNERMGAMEQEILSRNTEIQLLKQELMNRDSQVHRLEQQRQEFEQMRAIQEAGIAQQLMETQNKLMLKDNECTKLVEDLKTLRNEISMMGQDHQMLRQQLSKKEAHVQTLIHQTATEIESQKECEQLKKQLQEIQKAFEAEVNKHRHANEDLSSSLKQKQNDFNKHCDEKDNEVKALRKQLEVIHFELSKVDHDTEAARHKDLESALNDKNKLDAELAQMKEQIKAVTTQIHGKERENARLTEELNKVKTEYNNAINSSNGINSEEFEQLKQQAEHLDVTLSRRNAAVRRLEEDVVNITNEKSQIAARCDSLTQENQKLSKQIGQSSTLVNGHGTNEISGVVIDPEILKVNERSLAHINKQVISKEMEIAHLKEQLESLKAKNMILRNEKYKTVEAVQQSEKNVNDLIKKAEEKCRQENELVQKETRDDLCHILPGYKNPTNLNYKQFLTDYSEKLDKLLAEALKATTLVPVAKDSSKNNESKLVDDSIYKTRCDFYRDTLSKTEQFLSHLENEALQFEEASNEEKCCIQKQMNKLKHDTCICLSQQLKTSSEVQLQLNSLNSALQQERDERHALLQQLTERNELLKKEKVAGKDLSAQTIMLKGMLKTGEDSLKQEHKTVNELRQQLKSLQQVAGSQKIYEEIEELRKKLQQREQQLEKEMVINKQLNNKLASLGVT